MTTTMTVEELKRRGYEMGTHAQVWAALERMADAMEAGKAVSDVDAAWFAHAVKASAREQSVRMFNQAIGLVQSGQPKSVNKYDVAVRMVELIDGGMVKEHAARQVADEFKCSRATALHWLRREGGNL